MTAQPTVESELSVIERQTVEAAVVRILPSRHGAGAVEAGCPAYAVRAFERRYRGALGKKMRRGLRFLHQVSEQLFGRPFAELTDEQQDTVLLRLQQTPHPTLQDFFHRLVRLTLEGFLCHPKFGGNIGKVGWLHLGFCELDETSASSPQEIDPCTTP